MLRPRPHPTVGKPSKPTKLGRVALVPMTKAAYLKAGNRICAKMNAGTKALGRLPERAQGPGCLRGEDLCDHRARPQAADGAARPGDSAAKLAAYYVEVGKLDGTGKALAAALTAGKTDKAKTLEQKLAAQSTKANAEFTAYGLTACGQP